MMPPRLSNVEPDAARPKRVRQHGNLKTYIEGCRCDPCRAKHYELAKKRKARQRAQRYMDLDGRLKAPIPASKHGKTSTYNDWGCRCRRCTAANYRYMSDYYARKAAAELNGGRR